MQDLRSHREYKAATRISRLNCLLISDFCACSVGCVLLQLIQQLGSKQWCAVPLLFVCQALSKLPACPLLGVSGLNALRYITVFTV